MEKIIKDILINSFKKNFDNIEINNDDIRIEKPKDKNFGDFSTNLPMIFSRKIGLKPREIAQKIIDKIEENIYIEKCEVAGPGFINFYLKNDYLYIYLDEILSKKENFGKNDYGKDKKIQVEFVSCNPTGPLHIGHGRQAAIGDVLSEIFSWSGYSVTREYYYNNAGNQMNILGLSLKARYGELLGKNIDFPEDGYKGEYLIDIAKKLYDSVDNKEEILNKDLKFFTEYAAEEIRKDIEEDLKEFGVKFDVWYLESSLYENGKVDEALEKLKKTGYVFSSEDAIWLKTSAFGEDRDRVLIKKSGEPTYLLPDIAYHLDKFARGFDKVLNIHGADHHGQVSAMKIAMKLLNIPDGFLNYLLHQMVNLVSNGEKVKISTRSGEFITLKELVKNVGKDVARYFFIMRSCESHLLFDYDLALKKSSENPAYYIQYAHARLCSIISKAEENGFILENILNERNNFYKFLKEEEEKDLIILLYDFPNLIEKIASNFEVHSLPNYLQNLASKFHTFYQKHKVIDSKNTELTKARLCLVAATKVVLANGLKIMGLDTPERM